MSARRPALSLSLSLVVGRWSLVVLVVAVVLVVVVVVVIVVAINVYNIPVRPTFTSIQSDLSNMYVYRV